MDEHKNELTNGRLENYDELYKQHEDLEREIPVAVDGRAPQYNEANNGCHCSCPCARGAANADGSEAARDTSTAMDMKEAMSHEYATASSETSSNYGGDETANHDEGVEKHHLIEVGDFGFISLHAIHRALAKHTRCTCHPGLLPGADDYPFTTFNSPSGSGFLTPGDSASMIVEANSSADQSMASSQVLSVRSGGSSVLGYVGGGFTQVHVPIFRPLSLTPEAGYTYPIDIDISLGDFGEFDIW